MEPSYHSIGKNASPYSAGLSAAAEPGVWGDNDEGTGRGRVHVERVDSQRLHADMAPEGCFAGTHRGSVLLNWV